jgi:arsenite/tail-anchored protein-transporting ATPase
VRVSKVPLFPHEVLGMERLETLAEILYEPGEDPAAVIREERPYIFEKGEGGQSRVVLKMPFALKGEVGLFKKGDELVVQIGTLRRHIGLPTSMAGLMPSKAKLEGNLLTIEMSEVA